jgi:hypothetical protein
MRTLASVLTLLLLCARGLACDCVSQESLAEEITASSAIFSGKVTAIKVVKLGSREVNLVTLAPTKFYKGTPEKLVHVLTGTGSGDCGFSFETKRDYLVFAFSRRSEFAALGTNICTRTKLLTKDSDPLEAEVSQARSSAQ